MIGKIIKYMRKEKNLKQDVLGKLLNIDQTTLSGYETQKRTVSFEMMEKIAKECGFEVCFINKKTGQQFTASDLKRKDL